MAFALALALGCDAREEETSLERDVPFSCQGDADCPAGSCLPEYGICTRNEGILDTLLFEVTPQSSDPVYGGARFLTRQSVAAAPADGDRLELNVQRRVPVTGQVRVAPEQQACLSPARSTLPVFLTFTPREQLLGLSLPSYEFRTSFDDGPDEYVFQGSLPPGRYDVYMRPDFSKLSDDCRAIPQLFRNRSVGLMKGKDDTLELQQPPLWALRLTIAWQESLEGWQLDMVHPITGEVLSNRVELSASDVDPVSGDLITTLNYSRADDDFIQQAEELVRLRPPEGTRAGTVLLQRSSVEAGPTPGEGAIGNVSTFGAPVAFQAWVWKQGQADTPVPGTVSFSALELDEVANGVPASFQALATVDATGQVNASLLPGRYRVRVTPPGMALVNLGLMPGYESTVTVWPNGEPALDSQGGHVIEVPPAQSLAGQIVAETNGMPLRRVDVRASATHPDRNVCPDTDDEPPAPSCDRPRAPVLQRALARDPFIPRTRNALSGSDGRFEIEGLDCGRCEPGAPTYFDLTVRPDASTGLPWLVRSSVDPFRDAEDLQNAPLRIPMPVARPMLVTYDEPVTDLGPDPENPADDQAVNRRLAGALVRVFAILDNLGQLVNEPEALPPCISVPNPEGVLCLQSLIQVAEARTGSDGEFLLLLPPDLE